MLLKLAIYIYFTKALELGFKSYLPDIDGVDTGIKSPTLKAEYIAAADVDSMTCAQKNETYTIDLKIHAQKSVINAINSLAKGTGVPEITEADAVNSYFGTIIDEVNLMLIKYKVQLHLSLDAYTIEEFLGATASFDDSCEKTSAVEERTSTAFSNMLLSFPNNIGIHLFVWGCIFIPSTSELETIKNNHTCGRIMGVLWRGSVETKALIKGVIVNAITGSSDSFSSSDGTYAISIGPKLCDYVTSCIGMDKSEIGQLVPGTELVKYTKAATAA
ncbi:hypothetical protein H311_00994 [Anncaliia algerae PRA109]|nr:hypothetical protein H311_00994 [Anncaliia algerae PRA109]